MRLPLRRAMSVVIGITALTSVEASANTFTVFGPTRYVRTTGVPQSVTAQFSVLNPATDFVLRVDTDGVASATIAINGAEVVSPSRFNDHPGRIETPILAGVLNALSVELRGAPGGTLTITVIGADGQAPEIVPTLSEYPNPAGWHNRDVTVSFSCADAISGVQSCPSPILVTTEGRGVVVSGTAIDLAGNTSTASVSLNIDKTAPHLSIASPSNGATLFRSDAQVVWSAADALSGITSAECGSNAAQTVDSGGYMCAWTLGTGLNHLIVAATDAAGNVSTAQLDAILVAQTTNHVSGLSATPPVVEAATASVVTLSARITDDGTVDPAEVLAMRELPSSEAVALTRLVDDGRGGDIVAGDGIYTGQIKISDVTPVVAMFRVSIRRLPGLAMEFSHALALPIILHTTAEESRTQLIDQLRDDDLGSAYQLLGTRLAETNALERIGASGRVKLMEAIASCSVVQATAYFQLCAGEASDGTPFRFFMVPDQSGIWRVMSW